MYVIGSFQAPLTGLPPQNPSLKRLDIDASQSFFELSATSKRRSTPQRSLPYTTEPQQYSPAIILGGLRIGNSSTGRPMVSETSSGGLAVTIRLVWVDARVNDLHQRGMSRTGHV